MTPERAGGAATQPRAQLLEGEGDELGRGGEGRVSAAGEGGMSVIPEGERERLGRARGAARGGNLPFEECVSGLGGTG